MSLVLLFFAVGILLVGVDVFVPGSLLGVLGGMAWVAGVAVAFSRFGVNAGAYASGVALVLGGVALYLELEWLPKSRLARKFSWKSSSGGQSQPAIAARTVVGQRAVAITPLAPTGVVALGDRRYEAFARSGHVAVGAAVDIIDLDNFRLIVVQSSTISTT